MILKKLLFPLPPHKGVAIIYQQGIFRVVIIHDSRRASPATMVMNEGHYDEISNRKDEMGVGYPSYEKLVVESGLFERPKLGRLLDDGVLLMFADGCPCTQLESPDGETIVADSPDGIIVSLEEAKKRWGIKKIQ